MFFCLEGYKIKTDKVEYSVIKQCYTHTLSVFCALDDDIKIHRLLTHAKKFQPKILLQELKLQYIDHLTLKYKDSFKDFHKSVVELSNY